MHTPFMANLSIVLKSEIARLARKEVRAETATLKKACAAYRSQIAALKKHQALLERALKQTERGRRAAAEPEGEATKPAGVRYSAKSLAAQRKRLGLSAADFGALIGASALSVYHWEAGKSRPRERFIAALAAVRKIGRREAAQRLSALESRR